MHNWPQLNIHNIKKEIILISQSELYPKLITNMLIASLTVAISHNEAYWADRQLRVKLTRHHGPAHLVKNTAASTYRNLQLRAGGCFIKNWCATHQYREHVVQKQHKVGSSSLESPESRAVSLSLSLPSPAPCSGVGVFLIRWKGKDERWHLGGFTRSANLLITETSRLGYLCLSLACPLFPSPSSQQNPNCSV